MAYPTLQGDTAFIDLPHPPMDSFPPVRMTDRPFVAGSDLRITELLTGPDNYRSWLRRVRATLDAMGYWEAVQETSTTNISIESKAAREVIMSNLATHVMDELETNGWNSLGSAHELWTKLQQTMTTTPRRKLPRIFDEWWTIDRRSYTSVSEFYRHFLDLDRQMVDVGAQVPDAIWIHRLLTAMESTHPLLQKLDSREGG